jgi:hypothetical protein
MRLFLAGHFFVCCWNILPFYESLSNGAFSFVGSWKSHERVWCLLVLDSVTSAPQWEHISKRRRYSIQSSHCSAEQWIHKPRLRDVKVLDSVLSLQCRAVDTQAEAAWCNTLTFSETLSSGAFVLIFFDKVTNILTFLWASFQRGTLGPLFRSWLTSSSAGPSSALKWWVSFDTVISLFWH